MFKSLKLHYRILGLGCLPCFFKASLTHSTVLFPLERTDCLQPLSLRIPSSDVPTYKQVFLDQEYDFLIASPPAVIVDAGANIGLASIYFANRYPDARIIAIEPEQSNFESLKANTAAYPNITPIQAALWHKNEDIDLVDPGLGNWGFMTGEQNGTESINGNSLHMVPGMTIDKIMTDFQLDRINILKIDIEGAEKEVFSDSSRWITKVDSMIVELHERMKKGCNRSFYDGSQGFDQEWTQGENVYLSRDGYLSEKRH